MTMTVPPNAPAEGYLTPHERDLLERARQGKLPTRRDEKDIRAIQTLIGLGYLTPAEANIRRLEQ